MDELVIYGKLPVTYPAPTTLSRIRPWSSTLHLIRTPLSTVISNSSANHQLYADDTQFLLSFSALDFSHNITHFENAITIANWMSSKFPVLILLKLTFSSLVYHKNSLNSIILPFIYLTMSIGLLSPVDSARYLRVILDKNLSFAQHISSICKSCFLNIRDLWTYS